MERQVLTVTQLARKIKDVFRQNIGSVWVSGEISNVRVSPTGHMYLTLKDENAQISLALFKNIGRSLKFEIENGQKVLVFGEVTIYERSGSQFQIIVKYIEPVGIGSLQLAFEQLKEKLFKEGLFDQARKKTIPEYPNHIGIVTSPTGAAIRDMLNVTKRRYPIANIIIVPVLVQGDDACGQIADAIDLLNEQNNVDVIIVGRGGGSMEDLWAFNEEVVARSISRSEIPIISAVGHEIDFTISDFVADLRAATPSAAGELVVPDIMELKRNVFNLSSQLRNAMENKISHLKHKINIYKEHYAFKEPQGVLRGFMQKIDELDIRGRNAINVYIRNIRFKFNGLSGKMDVLSPLKVLSRGYSITVDVNTGNVVKKVEQVNKGDQIKIRLEDGEIFSKVI